MQMYTNKTVFTLGKIFPGYKLKDKRLQIDTRKHYCRTEKPEITPRVKEGAAAAKRRYCTKGVGLLQMRHVILINKRVTYHIS